MIVKYIAMKTENINKNFPGYPHYNDGEDITANENRVDADMEQITSLGNNVKPLKTEELMDEVTSNPTPNESDITEEDLKILGSVDQDMDEGEDETLLPLIKMNEDIIGGDLDVPGNDYDDDDMDLEDEENNLFSKGQN